MINGSTDIASDRLAANRRDLMDGLRIGGGFLFVYGVVHRNHLR